MEYRHLGRSGLKVSTLALGTMTFGGTGDFSALGGTGADQARNQLDIALELQRNREVCEMGRHVGVARGEPAERRAVWEARRLISPALKQAYRVKVNEDVCVPRGRIIEISSR